MGYLPDGYKVPKDDGLYMKFREGKNRFRILTEPLIGWEYWTESRKPVRAKELWKTIPADADISKGWNPKHFWAFVVWNLDAEKLQILEITQKTILERLQGLIENEDWGDPREYSITITREGADLQTKYVVDPSPHKPIPAEVIQKFEESDIKLEALIEGKDPVEQAEVNPEDVPF